MCCCAEESNDGRGGTPVPTSSPALLVIATTVAVVDDVPIDLFAGQAAPQAATFEIPANSVNIGGIRWNVEGTLLNNSGGTRFFTLSLVLNGVTIYSDDSQGMGSSATARPWQFRGSITRKGPLLGHLGMQMSGHNGTPTGAITGLGPLNAVGTGLSPSLPLANGIADFACDWSIAQRLEMRVSFDAAVANESFAISGGSIERFGS